MKLSHIVLILLFLTINSNPLLAQKNLIQYNYHYLNIRNGLCDNSIRAIHKDKESFMWIGTSNGLDRYDGYDIKHYSTASSLPYNFIESNYINDLKEDKSQHLWIASESGIMCLDMVQEHIDFFKQYKGNNQSVITTPIQTIFIDDWGNLWIGKNDCLAYAILNEKREIIDIRVLKKEVNIKSIIKHGNEIWAGGINCLFRFSTLSYNNIMPVSTGLSIDIKQLTFNCLYSYGDYLWMGTSTGLYCYNTQNNIYTHHQHNSKLKDGISCNNITDISRNTSGDIIIGTRNGINIYLRNNKFVILKKENPNRSLNDNIVNKIFVDESNNIWAGTDFGGINLLSPQNVNFSYLLQGHEKGTPNVISTVLEDKEGNLLIGIVDGGLAIKKRGTSHFMFYKQEANNPHSLSHNNVSDIVQDFNGDYWIATIGGGIDKLSRKNLLSPRFEHYNTSTSNLLSNDIYDITLDSVRNSLWICSDSHINILSFSTNKINRLQYFLRSNEKIKDINTVFIDSQSRLWIGGNGVYIIELNNPKNGYECTYYPYKLDNPESRINERISCVFETKNKDIYLGTVGNGIYLLDKNSRYGKYKFTNFAVRSGLSDTSICHILDDDSNNLWISTMKGVYFFNKTTKRAFKFDENDGLLVPQFYKRSGCKSKDHGIILGSIDGIVSFSPIINPPKKKDRVVIPTLFTCDGKEFIPYLDKNNLERSISKAHEVHLYPPQNSFELTFSCLDYTEQDKIFYFHRILELKESINVGLKKRHAKYTNLAPGNYTLEMWCTNYNNTWSSVRTYLTIVVHPPFYKTKWFYALITGFVLFILAYIIYSYNLRQKNIQKMLRHKIDERTSVLAKTISELTDSKATIVEQNRQLLTQNEEINKQKNEIIAISQQVETISKEKLSYFTNLAHEFKTPLTLIQGPTTQLLKQITNKEQCENLLIINRNAKYLLSLVNQLIDLRKIDTQNFTLNFTNVDLQLFLDQTVKDFSGLIKEREIIFRNIYHFKNKHILSDKENLHKVLFNLLSNAIKHTPNQGKISLYAKQFTNHQTEELIQYISVCNSGSMIADDEIHKIFDCYYRIADQDNYSNSGRSSTGIGLHIVKEIITSLKGEMKVRSSKKTGVAFRAIFPVRSSSTNSNEVIQRTTDSLVLEEKEDKLEPFIIKDRRRATLLLVEDNPDMRHYIKNILKERYNVAETNNGEAGYKMAQNILPDFIISDLMMPICDGINFCKMIRDDEVLCHIPFLLLTANSSETARTESFESGADGYITKPFEESVLLAHIDAILKNRSLRQKRFIEEDLNLATLEVGYSDQQFMNEVMHLLEKNYADSEFGVKELSESLNLSYALIYKKIISLTGIPPVKFILLYRLKIAKQILENSRNNNVIVAEIAYRVGFNDPKYFTRCFVKQYNITPSSIIK